VTEIAAILCREMERTKVLSFARFMEVALYCPETGYYERNPCRIGRSGDFITSVNVGQLFGELLAGQFADWMEGMGAGSVQLVEAGAHEGQLALDILTWFHQWRPQLANRVEYYVVEPSPRRQVWQRARLDKFAGQVHWCSGFKDFQEKGIRGVVFSNELLDAFPVHILRWDALESRWREWGVGLRGNQFVWERMGTNVGSWRDELMSAGFEVPPALAEHLPDGFTVEFSLAAAAWWREAAAVLRVGKLLTIDYGGSADELMSPARERGTLRAFARHRLSDDILAQPGEQDLTAHVNFTHLIFAGEQAGLETDGLLSQTQFLTRAMAVGQRASSTFGEWSSARVRQFQTLTHPEHLGRAFRVLIQSRAR
jgi:SAM-dependent MidA family methyltransferase